MKQVHQNIEIETQDDGYELWSRVTSRKDCESIILLDDIEDEYSTYTTENRLWAVEYEGKYYVFADEESFITDELLLDVDFVWGDPDDN